MHWHFCTQNRSSLFIWLIDTIIVYNFHAGETNTKTFCLPKNDMSIWIWFTYRISRFEKLSYTTKSFQSHSTKFASKTWLSVWEIRIWTFGLNSSSDFRLATRHFYLKLSFDGKIKIHTRFPQSRKQQCAGILQVCLRSCCMSMKFSKQIMACRWQLTHKHRCTYIACRRT